MAIKDVARHEVSEQRIEQALEGIERRAHRRWHTMQYDCYSDQELRALRGDLLDHVAARTVTDPGLSTAPARRALRTAAECALGFLELGCAPNGDQEIHFPLVDEYISSENTDFGAAVEHASTARDWLDAFALCVISGMIWQPDRVIGLLLREHASTIHDGVPHSNLDSTSDPAELAQMDTLSCYLAQARGHLPRDRPTVALYMPEVDERLDAALSLNSVGPLSSDQRLLRALLEDNQPVFEQALERRLIEYRKTAPSDAAPRSLLPPMTIALAALAVQVHGWDLRVQSAYLPRALLNVPEDAPPVSG